MKPEIREAIASDYDELCELYEEGDALHRENLPHLFQQPGGPARERDYILGLISDQAVGLFIARLGRQAVGLICVIIRQSSDNPIMVPRRYAVIDTLVVKRDFQRAGLGRALMEKAEAWTLAQDINRIELNVYEFNQGAIEFYRRLGYETSSRKMGRWLGRPPQQTEREPFIHGPDDR